MSYPQVLSEDNTIAAAAAGRSLARYGDGEYALCLGGNCVSQRFDPGIQKELRAILLEDGPALPCIPNLGANLPAHKAKSWDNYRQPKHLALLDQGRTYGSSFISRPDSAPWIDTGAYWASVKALWAGQDVTLVTGHYNELRLDQMDGATSVREVVAPRQHAYAEIDRIEEEIGQPSGVVLMCLGPTATVLAARLARKGVHALDLGHLGLFMRHAGQYRVQLDQLITIGYQDELQAMHLREKGWGADGWRHADAVRGLIERLKPKTLLDYGCGRGKLGEALKGEFRVQEYDPGVPGKTGMPKPVDLVVCTDVLEHVEPKMIGAVLNHIFKVAETGAYLVIATNAAKAVLPGGRNAHLLVKPHDWWLEQLTKAGWPKVEVIERAGNRLKVLVLK